jgi:hypothetical protein
MLKYLSGFETAKTICLPGSLLTSEVQDYISTILLSDQVLGIQLSDQLLEITNQQ